MLHLLSVVSTCYYYSCCSLIGIVVLRMVLFILSILVIVGSTVACSAVYTPPLDNNDAKAATAEDRFMTLDRWLQKLYKSNRFNGTVLIGDADRIYFVKSYGFEDPEFTRQFTENSAFNLASVSKQFTAMAVLLLEQEGKLTVADPLSEHIPELANYPDVTIEHLLHHTSGIADYMQLAIKNNADRSLFTTDDLIALFAEQEPALQFEPGSKFRYSNSGYVLLAEIVARASGQSFEAFMQEKVFKPSDMPDTRVFNRLSTSEPTNRVFGFKRKRFNRAQRKLHDLNNFDGVVGDGGIYSSARDLYQWHKVLLDGKLLPHANYRRAIASGVLSDGSETGYGYGWFLRGDSAVEHAGGWVGFSSFYYRNLESGKVIVVLDNSTNALRVGAKGFRFTSIGLNLIEFVERLPNSSD